MKRSLGAPIIILGACVVLTYVVLWFRAVDSFHARGSDFSATYVASLLIREGHAGDLYDEGLEGMRHASILPPNKAFHLDYFNPPTAALGTVPLSLLDPDTAYRVFGVIQLLLLGAGCWFAVKAARWPPGTQASTRLGSIMAAQSGTPTLLLLLLGQWDGLCAFGVGVAAWLWSRGKGAAACAALVLTIGTTKPHLAVGLGVFILGRCRPREVLAACVAVVAVLLSWVAIVGMHGLSEYVSVTRTALGILLPQQSLSATGLATSWFGVGHLAGVIAVVIACAATAVGAWLGMRSAQRPGDFDVLFAGAVVASLLATPHLLGHDLVLAAPAFVLAMAWASRRDTSTDRSPSSRYRSVVVALWIALITGVALDSGSTSVGAPGRLTPVVLMVAAAGVIAFAAIRRESVSLRQAR